MATVSTFVMLMASFNPVLTARTAANLALLGRGALLATGPRTVTSCLRAAWPWVENHWSAYHNVLRRARLNGPALAHVLFALAMRLVPRRAVVELALDDTPVRRYGPRVMGVAMHRDTVRSSHGYHAVTPGHKWVVLSLLLRLPFWQRAVALPLLSALYSTQKHARRNRQKRPYRRHRTLQEPALILWCACWCAGRPGGAFASLRTALTQRSLASAPAVQRQGRGRRSCRSEEAPAFSVPLHPLCWHFPFSVPEPDSAFAAMGGVQPLEQLVAGGAAPVDHPHHKRDYGQNEQRRHENHDHEQPRLLSHCHA
jgi:hypothetical protein